MDISLDLQNLVHTEEFENQELKSEISSDSKFAMNSKCDFSVEKLRGSENFHDWLFSMGNYLAMKGYTDCITEVTTTEGTGATSITVTQAKEKDATKLGAAKKQC